MYHVEIEWEELDYRDGDTLEMKLYVGGDTWVKLELSRREVAMILVGYMQLDEGRVEVVDKLMNLTKYVER